MDSVGTTAGLLVQHDSMHGLFLTRSMNRLKQFDLQTFQVDKVSSLENICMKYHVLEKFSIFSPLDLEGEERAVKALAIMSLLLNVRNGIKCST